MNVFLGLLCLLLAIIYAFILGVRSGLWIGRRSALQALDELQREFGIYSK